MRPQPVPLVVSVEDVAPGGKPAMTRRDPQRDWSQGFPPPKPRKGGFDMKIRSPAGGAVPRLNSLLVPGEGSINSPYDDPNSPLPFEPIEKDQPTKPWKVLRSHNGNLPVYTRYHKAGSEVLTVVHHFFGDIEAMRKELMQVCEAPVRIRAGHFEVRGLHVWKIKEWLVKLSCKLNPSPELSTSLTARAARGVAVLRRGADRHLDRLEQWLERRRKARCYKALDAELRRAARAAEILDSVGVQEFLIGPSSRTVESCESLCFEDEEVLGALVRYQLKHSSTLSQVLQGRPWREILPRCLCQVTVAFMVGLALFCLLAAMAFAPTRSLALGPAGEVAAPPAAVAAAAAAVTLRPLWQFPMLSLQELRQVENVVFEENQLRHSLRVAVTSKMSDGSVLLQSTDSSLRVEKSGRGFWLRDGQEVPLDDMEALRQLPGADEGLAWMGAQLTTEVVAPA
ncbi:unnamed protein product [Symbiodinium sp. CCMP2592]|nr:unnamed protein product [Symbiodinium sp. CCMP2592]